jgi:DNA-binding transcriptional regulator YhcF (GntR family)
MSPSAPRIRVDATLPTPIWSQIEEAVRYLVASGALRPGGALPSVRDLARDQQVNPNTVAKAYQRLVEGGIVETRRGEGTFVAERPPAMPPAEKARLVREGATRFSTLAVNLGLAQAEAVTALRAAWPADETAAKGDER